MKTFLQKNKFIIALFLLSVIFYLATFWIFGRPKEIVFLLFNSLAFAFLQVLLVTLVIERVISEHEKKAMIEKLNMVIGVFFNEVGTDLLKMAIARDDGIEEYGNNLKVGPGWGGRDFQRAREAAGKRKHDAGLDRASIAALKDFMSEKRDFLLRLLENPVLLEHETFTELMRAVFHLAEELHRRTDMASLPESDMRHIKTDFNRAYGLLIFEWLSYVEYLKVNYPYLFSLEARMNPFVDSASPVVKE
jgi:hypothetical protein